jgi:signal transduction histidine kinase
MEKVKKYYSVMWNTCIWEGQHACILQISDLTLEHEKAEKIQWQRINEYKDELLATVSHDLKTPLNSILISIQAMSYDSPVAEFDEHREMLLTNA